MANPAKAQALLQWKATRGLRDVVTTAWNWMERRAGPRHEISVCLYEL